MMLSGSIPAVVTPFDADGAVAEDALRAHVERLIEQGSSAVVACGTTGEAATLTGQEHIQVVRACVEQAGGRVPVVAGAGSNDTRVAAQTLRAVADAGADAALVVAPAYNRPSQEGLFQHFATLAQGAALPMLVYNVPSRTVTDVEPRTLLRIVAAASDVVVGIKDSSGVLTRVSDHRAGLGPTSFSSPQRRARPCVQRDGRCRLHLRHRQRSPPAVRRPASREPGRPAPHCTGPARPACPAAHRAIQRRLTRPGQVRPDPPHPRLPPFAAAAHDLAQPHQPGRRRRRTHPRRVTLSATFWA